MKLRTYIATGLALALGAVAAYVFTQKPEESAPETPRPDAPRPATTPQEDAAEQPPAAGEQPAPQQPVAVEPPAAPEPTPAPEPQPEPTPAPVAPAPEPARPAPSALPDVDYGVPGTGHEPEKYPVEYARFREKLDEQVKLNLYDFCPAVQVLLAATNDEFALDVWMKKAADEGNAAAMLYVAELTLSYVPADKLQDAAVKEAYALLCKAADKGYDPAKCTVNECLANGIGTKKDETAAKKVIMEACKSGSFIPRFRWLLLDGRLQKFEDRERAEVKAEIDRGNHHVVYYLSRFAPDSPTQLEWLRNAAKLGNGDAFYELAVVCFSTRPKESYELLKAAASLHNREALYLLGTSLLNDSAGNAMLKSLGLHADERTALRLIKTAAAMRSPRAVYFMGRAYYEGTHGMPEDKQLAYRHFSQALALRSPDLGAALGLMLLRGEGVEQDIKRGQALIAAAANGRYPYAVCLMAYAFYNGLGTTPDAGKAAELLQEAAALGHSPAYVYLAFITAKGGAGAEPNPRLAESYLRMASVDMKEKAQKLYDELEKAGKWEPKP